MTIVTILWVKAVSSDVVYAVRQALAKYGAKVKIVLETALEIAKSNRLKGEDSLGDFDFRSLVEALRFRGFNYNPSQLLRILEREYGIIETSYRSNNQHWYRFKDLEAVESALSGSRWSALQSSGYAFLDPKAAMLKIQIKSLRPMEVLNFLKTLLMKPRITTRDAERFEEFAFNKLPRIVDVLRRAEDYEDVLSAEIGVLKEIIEMAYEVAERISRIDFELGLGVSEESVNVFREAVGK